MVFSFKTHLKTAALSSVIGLATWVGIELLRPAYVGAAGIKYGSAFASVRNRNVDFYIWYPAQNGGRQVTVGGNGVF